jgi:hypothetical protein
MATAISYTSESGDHYLSLYEGVDSIQNIVRDEKYSFGDEFGYLYIQNIESTDIDEGALSIALQEAIEEASDEY